MKKIYILALAFFGLTLNAQFTDDFESYPTGPYFGGHWSTWSGSAGAESIIVSIDQASSGTKSGFIGGDTVQDAVLKLGNKTGGIWTVEWKMFVTFASTGYYNFQENEVIGAGTWGVQVQFNFEAATPGVGIFQDDTGVTTGNTFNYPEEEWFTLRHVINLDTDTAVIYLNDTEIYNGPFYSQSATLGAVDFYSVDANNAYYIDDVVFMEGTMGVNDNSLSSISVYPTVANDIINVSAKSNISEVAVFNMSGQQVLRVSPQGTSTQVNVSALPAGAYVVKTIAGKETKSTKVVVK